MKETRRGIVIPRDGEPYLADLRPCESLDHAPKPAAVTLHLVQGPTDYCVECAEKMAAIYAALGTHLHAEPIRLPPNPDGDSAPARGLALTDVPPSE